MSIGTLEKIHEDLFYIIECLAEETAGEAKYELSRMNEYLIKDSQIPHSDIMLERVEAAAGILRESSNNIVKASACPVYVRQHIRSDLEIRQGRKRNYNVEW